MSERNDDDLLIVDDQPNSGDDATGGIGEMQWPILVVDDDHDVHAATAFALSGVRILGRTVKIHNAHSSEEAKQQLAAHPDVVLVLLDVVMEMPDAGLKLVEHIRNTLNMKLVQIVLRTGQPGYAPELDVVQGLDINDYRTKDELTRTRLIATITNAVRAHQHLHALDCSRQGLTKIIHAVSNLFSANSMELFAEGVLTQMAGLIDGKKNGLVIVRRSEWKKHPEDPGHCIHILAASGQYQPMGHRPWGDFQNPLIQQKIYRSLQQRKSFYEEDSCTLFATSPSGEDVAVCFETHRLATDTEKQLLDIFALNMANGYDNVQMFEKLKRTAYTDPLTGLPNHAGCRSMLEQMIHHKQPVAVTLLDIDGFDTINSGLGSQVGDEVLRTVGHMLQAIGGHEVVHARMGGDCFAMVYNHHQVDADAILTRLHHDLRRPIKAGPVRLPISLTHGCSNHLDDEANASMLLKRAGMALNSAKKNKRGGGVMYRPSMAQSLDEQLMVITCLPQAIQDEAFHLVYQPQLELATRKLVGVEALVRWQKDDGTVINPSQFIPAAERSGHIVALGQWVLKEACRQMRLWQDQGLLIEHMGVNVSARQLKEPGVVEQIANTVQQAGLRPQDITLELTETTLLDDLETAVPLLEALRAMGFHLSMDDFGSGYSSLHYLNHLPMDTIKIDRSFVSEMDKRPDRRKIAAMIVGVSRELGRNVVAEGIETMAEAQILLGMGCKVGQGFYYAKPLDAKAIEQTLKHSEGLVWPSPKAQNAA